MVEIDSGAIVAIVLSITLGIPFLVTSFFMIRRLHELHMTRQKIEGELFISEDGEIFSEFHIPIDDIMQKKTILLKVTKVNPKLKEGNQNGDIST